MYLSLTASITAFLVVIAALGEMLFPVIVGNVSVFHFLCEIKDKPDVIVLSIYLS